MQTHAPARRVRSAALVNSLIVMAGTVLSRVTGLLRDVVISAQFGTSNDLGAYRIAFSVTDLLYMVIIGGALGSSFIPVFIELWERDGQARAWRLASAVVTWSLLLLAIASAVLWLVAPLLVARLYAGPNVSAATLTLAAELTRLFLFSPLLLGLGGLAMAVLNARDRFTLPALAPSLYNLGIIGGALVAPWLGGIWALGWGVVLGALLYVLVQLPGLLRVEMRLRPTLGRDLPALGKIARQMMPRVLGQAAAQVSIAVTIALATRLALGTQKVAALGYAYSVMLLPYGVFSLSLSTVAFPRLARLHAEGRHDELAATVRRTLSAILLLTLPATVALILLGVPIVRVLYQRGLFDASSLAFTTEALLGYASALPAFAASEILIRAFYAMQRTWTPVLVGFFQVTLNLGLGIALLGQGQVGALTFAFSLANNIEALLLFLLLARLLPGLWRERELWRTLGAAVIAAVLMGGALFAALQLSSAYLPTIVAATAYDWRRDILPLALWLGLTMVVSATFYLGCAALLGARQPRELVARLWQRGKHGVKGGLKRWDTKTRGDDNM